MLKWNAATLFAQQETKPILEQLDPPHRAMVLMAILGLILLGALMVACVMLGARWVRREARHRRKTDIPVKPKAAAAPKRLGELPNGSAGETIHLDLSKGETRSD